jgi:hypothetical protein
LRYAEQVWSHWVGGKGLHFAGVSVANTFTGTTHGELNTHTGIETNKIYQPFFLETETENPDELQVGFFGEDVWTRSR